MAKNDVDSKFSGKRVVITGGMGFIGSNLARRLVDAGAEVTIIDSLSPEYGGNPFNLLGIEQKLKICNTDLREAKRIHELMLDQNYLFHLAAQVSHIFSMRNPVEDLDINCRATVLLLEACRAINPEMKIVYSGTRQVYGHPKYLPVDELHPLNPMDFNGANKLAADLYHMLCHRVYGLHTVCLRLTNVYGPRMRVKDSSKNFIGWWIRQAIEGKAIPVYGDGMQIRDFNFIEDVLDALLTVAIHPKTDGEIYNLGHPDPMRLLDLAKLLIELSGKGSYQLMRFPPERSRIDIGDYHGDFSKIQKQLGWAPRIPMREGLVQTLSFYREHRVHYW
jgi:UDP-glucose 4-epimerase